MASKYVKTYSLKNRKSKVSCKDFAAVYEKGGTFEDFFNGLPSIIAGKDIRNVVRYVVKAVKRRKPILLGVGAHVIKCGLSPVIIDLINKGIIGGIATTGATTIHDFEVGLVGRTSEDVKSQLSSGKFGMAEETGKIMNKAIEDGYKKKIGMGETLGRKLVDMDPPYGDLSILWAAKKKKVPVTVHVGVGTDIIHQHPSAKGDALGWTSFKDFKIFTDLVSRIGNGGAFINFGSAVILPEVFLKALSISRNLGISVKDFMTVNFDMIKQYRPMQTIVARPVAKGGKGYYLVGHHEIMIPLFAAAVIEELGK